MIVAVPLIALAAALWCAVPRSGRAAPAVSFAASVAILCLSLRLLWATRDGTVLSLASHWIVVDPLSSLLLALIATVYMTASLFSWGYLEHEHPDQRRLRLYHANFNLFAFSMLTIPLMAEVGLVWIFVELTTLLSVLLVSFALSTQALEAAWKYMVLTLLGATIAVLGILVLFWALHSTGSTDFSWDGLRAAAPHMPGALLGFAFVLLLLGYGAKIGFVPLHTWLPDAHSQAPSPVCAMLSGVETSVVLYVLLRLRNVFAADPSLHVGNWFAVVGLLSVGAAAFLITQTRDYKRLFAFSTIEHMGIIFTAASLFTPAGDLATLWQMLAHGITKSFCFYAAGVTLIATGTREIADVKGMLGVNRIASAALLFGALAIGGAPPFAAFLSEFAILRAGLLASKYAIVVLLAIFIGVAFCGLVAHVAKMLGDETKEPRESNRLPATCVCALVIAAVPVIVFGVWLPNGLSQALQSAARVLGT